jgi:tetratricopeptide (TPR) repeat protein
MSEEQKNLSQFLETKRNAVLGCAVFLVCASLCFIAAMLVFDWRNKKAISILDEDLLPRYEKLAGKEDASATDDVVADTTDAAPAASDTPAPEAEAAELSDAGSTATETAETEVKSSEEELELFIKDAEAFANKYSGYASAKIFSVLGKIYMQKLDWTAARNAYEKSAKKGKKTYLAPVSLYNAAAAAEEEGNAEDAISLYNQAIFYEDFPAAAHAQFSIGRLYESLGKNEDAKSAYQSVIDNWSKETNWTNHAHSRLIALDIASVTN